MKKQVEVRHRHYPKHVRLVVWPLYLISWPVRHISVIASRALRGYPRLAWLGNETFVGFVFSSGVLVALFLVDDYVHKIWYSYTMEVAKGACAEPILHGVSVVARFTQEIVEDA